MKWKVPAFAMALVLAGATGAMAQDTGDRRPAIEIAFIPAGAAFFAKGGDTGEPSFTNYDYGASLTFNVNRYLGIQAEASGALGIAQNLQFATFEQQLTSPNLLAYSGNLVVSIPTRGPIVPFVTGGAGGLSLYERDDIFQNTKTFFAGNVGGGVKWYHKRVGLRADYRFMAVRSRDVTAGSAERIRGDFFGKETRFGHRVYGGVILNIG